MFSHTVLVKFSETGDAFLNAVGEYVERIRNMGDGVQAFSLYKNTASRNAGFSYAFIGKFIDEAAHDRYQTSPVHQELKDIVMPRIVELIVLDHDGASMF